MKRIKKIRILFFVFCAAYLLVGCKQSDTGWIEYTFDHSEKDVKFSVQYPNGWQLIEQRGYDGSENQEANPSTGICFPFFENDDETFSIMAMLVVPFEVDETLFESASFETSTGFTGAKYTRIIDDRIYVYYIFGDGETLPQYFAVVDMRLEHYEMMKNDIEAVIDTFKMIVD